MVTARGTRFWQIATGIVSAAVLTVLTAGGIFLGVSNNDLRHDLSAAHGDLRASTLNAEDLYRQLISEGIAPEAEKPSNVVKGEAGSDGARGLTGARGADGVDGLPGVAGINGIDGALGVSGGTGADGSNGSDGATGSAGADGAPGATGPAGADGTNSGPRTSVTFITDKGSTTCTLVEPVNDAAPTYTCVQN